MRTEARGSLGSAGHPLLLAGARVPPRAAARGHSVRRGVQARGFRLAPGECQCSSRKRAAAQLDADVEALEAVDEARALRRAQLGRGRGGSMLVESEARARCSSARSVPRCTGSAAASRRAAHAPHTGPPSGDVEARSRRRAFERRGRSARSAAARGAGRARRARAARAACAVRASGASLSIALRARRARSGTAAAGRARAPPSGASRSSSSSR